MFRIASASLTFLALSVLSFVTVSAQSAEQTEKQKLISEFRKLTGADNVRTSIDISLDDTKKDLSDLVEYDKELNDLQRQELRKTAAESIGRLETQLRSLLDEREKITAISEESIFEVYDKEFTTAELRETIDFYSSPTGQKVMKFLRDLNSKYQEVFQGKMLLIVGDFIKPKIKAETDSLAEKIRAAKGK